MKTEEEEKEGNYARTEC